MNSESGDHHDDFHHRHRQQHHCLRRRRADFRRPRSFHHRKEFAKLSTDWPITRFVEVWNAFAGAPPFGELKPVKKFTDRKTAVARIWKAIQP